MQTSARSLAPTSIAQTLPVDKLKRLSMTEHISRMEISINGIINLLNIDRQNMRKAKQYITTMNNKANSQAAELVSTLRHDTQRLKNLFSVSVERQKKDLQELKTQVNKLSGQQINAQQQSLHLDDRVRHCENQIGFKQLLKK